MPSNASNNINSMKLCFVRKIPVIHAKLINLLGRSIVEYVITVLKSLIIIVFGLIIVSEVRIINGF